MRCKTRLLRRSRITWRHAPKSGAPHDWNIKKDSADSLRIKPSSTHRAAMWSSVRSTTRMIKTQTTGKKNRLYGAVLL
jgi:hypothetical protein